MRVRDGGAVERGAIEIIDSRVSDWKIALADTIFSEGLDLLGRRFRPCDPAFDWLADPEQVALAVKDLNPMVAAIRHIDQTMTIGGNLRHAVKLSCPIAANARSTARAAPM